MLRMMRLLLPTVVLANGISSASAEIDTNLLIGEWCLLSQSMTDYESDVPLPKAIRENLKAEVGQGYHFIDAENVDITLTDGSVTRFTYKISGSKGDRVKIRKWERFAIGSLTETEMTAKVLGAVRQRFSRGKCK